MTVLSEIIYFNIVVVILTKEPHFQLLAGTKIIEVGDSVKDRALFNGAQKRELLLLRFDSPVVPISYPQCKTGYLYTA